MPEYSEPQTFTTGQIVGRAALGILQDNDDFFHALADRWRPIARAVVRGWIGTETTGIPAWDGYHWLESDAQLLNYHFSVTSVNGAEPNTAVMYYDYGGDNQVQIASATDTTGAGATASGTYDFSRAEYPVGFHRVYVAMTRTDGGNSGEFVTRAPFTTYTGALGYSTPTFVTDALLSNAAHFNAWRSNDLYFNAVKPRQPAFCGISRAHVGNDTQTVVWDGWVRHVNRRLYYKLALSIGDGDANTSNNRIILVYDYGGGLQKTYLTYDEHGTTESYADLDEDRYTVGQWYRVVVRLNRDDATYNAAATVHYLYTTPPNDDTQFDVDYTIMADLEVNQWVYGNTPGNLTRLDLLSYNDRSIFQRLCENASTGRRDYAVSKSEFIRLGDTDRGEMYLIRRGDTLYYRVKGASLLWGTDSSQGLDDYDDDNAYHTLDLNSIDIPYGSGYRIDGSYLEYAMEK